MAALTDAGAARRTEIAPVHAVFHAEGAPAPMTAIAREIVSQALPDFSDKRGQIEREEGGWWATLDSNQ